MSRTIALDANEMASVVKSYAHLPIMASSGRRSSSTVRSLQNQANLANPSRRRRGILLFSGALLAAALSAGAIAATSQVNLGTPSTSAAEGPPVRRVSVVLPALAAAGTLTLPASLQGAQSADLYARTSGYLRIWRADIGQNVMKGQVLAEIDTPEIDRELDQAIAQGKQSEAEWQQAKEELKEAQADFELGEANVVKARADFDYANSKATRYDSLLSKNAVSREEFEGAVRDRDARRADISAAKADLARRRASLSTKAAIISSREATVNSRRASEQRLRELQGFESVVAPFDGVITRRNAEVGMLVAAGNATRPLFSLTQVNLLKAQVAVPQSDAVAIHVGESATVQVPELPGVSFAGRVARTAGAVDPTSRTLLVELELPNDDGRLMAGLYAQVHFALRRDGASIRIPTNTLLMKNDGTHVVVANGNVVRIVKVSLGRDFGNSVEALAGLRGNERLVINPADDLRDGQEIEVVELAGTNGNRP